mmetsp:Transcript_9298/g.15664  ORF Transcript_9298/g.15664 Transcript_9298/m.15664 type:complete len:80 (+) Transcript_9298:799-1038(+)
MVATCSRDEKVIIWKVVILDVYEDQMLKTPLVQPLQAFDQKMLMSQEIQRMKWNILGTTLAMTSHSGEVQVWQRSQSHN